MALLIKRKKKKYIFWKLFLWASFVGIVFLAFVAVLATAIKLPDIANFEENRVVQSTKIYDRTGTVLLYDIHGEEKRTVIPFGEMPQNIKNATIALEDNSFYSHYGFRPLSFARAMFTNILLGGFEQGGSTITQQVVKNTLLTKEKTIIRKFKEIIIALRLERKYSKDEILNLYLNQIPYGNGAYGIEAAAETFFNKHAKDLGTLEAIYLASLPNAPSYFSPYGKHVKELDSRAIFTLGRMRDLKYITKEEYDSVMKEKIKFSPARTRGIIAPHFVIEVRDELNKKFGEDVVEKEGFKVITTLDVPLQQKVEEVVQKHAEEIEKSFNATNEAVVALDPKSGDILAMVGSRDYFNKDREGNFNITTALRQPGSAFKPFVYATAFKNGLTPETTLFDLPTEFNPSCNSDGLAPQEADQDKCYHPQNYDEKFRGPVSLRESLAQSLNVPSVKTLYLAGLNESLAAARDFGITSLNDPDRYGLTLVLGGGEVSLLELTTAYGAFANDAVYNSYRYILKIENSSGETLYQSENSPSEIIDKNIARAINDILSDNNARIPAFGEDSALFFPGRKVAAKTGTTNDYRDALVLGYTPDIVIGAWAGNNNNTPMEKKVAGFIVAPWWHEIMEYALTNIQMNGEFIPPEPFPQDKPYMRGEWRGGVEYILDKISGKLVIENTPKDFQEKKVIREIHSILYWINGQSPQFKNWEAPVRKWAEANGYYDEDKNIIPTEYDDVHSAGNAPKINSIEITPPKTSYGRTEKILVKPAIESKFYIKEVDYFLNGEFIDSVKNPPFEMLINLNIQEDESVFELKIKIYDSIGNSVEKQIILNIN